jgi:hypothetical protein
MTIQGPGQLAAALPSLPSLPERLNTIVRFEPTAAAVTRPMELGGDGRRRTINGISMTSEADTMQIRLGDLERWNVVNRSDDTQVLHAHDVQFQILERNGDPPGRPTTVRPSPNPPWCIRRRFRLLCLRTSGSPDSCVNQQHQVIRDDPLPSPPPVSLMLLNFYRDKRLRTWRVGDSAPF